MMLTPYSDKSESIATVREIELHCGDKHYFLSRYSDTEWYFWCEETKEKQIFASGEELYRKRRLKESSFLKRFRTLELMRFYKGVRP